MASANSLDKVDMSLDDIIKLNRKKGTPAANKTNKVKEFRARVGKKRVQGVSPLNRTNFKNANQKFRRTAAAQYITTRGAGNNNVGAKQQTLTQTKRSLQAAKKTLARVERELNRKTQRTQQYNQRRNIPQQHQAVTQVTQRRRLNRNFNARNLTGFMRSDNQREWTKPKQNDVTMQVSIPNRGLQDQQERSEIAHLRRRGLQNKDVQVTLKKSTHRRLTQQAVRGGQTRGGRGAKQRGRGARQRGGVPAVLVVNQQPKPNARFQRKQRNTRKQNQYQVQDNQATFVTTKTNMALSDRFSYIQPTRGRGGNNRGRGGNRRGRGRGNTGNQGERQVFL